MTHRSHYLRACAVTALLLTATAPTSTKKSSSYTLPVGKADLERLTCLNDVINPHSVTFLKQHIKPGDHVLELAAGYGMMSQEIAKIVGKTGTVVATDISDSQLEIARSLAKDSKLSWLTFKTTSATDLSNLQEKYDVVYMRLLLMHMPNPMQVIKQVKSVLKPHGMLIIEDSAWTPDELRSDPYDKRIDLIKRMARIQQKALKTQFGITKLIKKKLPRHGFKLLAYNEIEPPLDTANKRRNFSLAIDSFKPALLKQNVVKETEIDAVKKAIMELEADPNIKLYFPKFGQIAARLQTPTE